MLESELPVQQNQPENTRTRRMKFAVASINIVLLWRDSPPDNHILVISRNIRGSEARPEASHVVWAGIFSILRKATWWQGRVSRPRADKYGC
jgi:hypothetical protein